MSERQRPLKVFLCYAHSDKEAVRKLYRRLTRDGVDVWLDEKRLLPGQEWRTLIEDNIRTSDMVIICLSRQVVEKEGFLQKEMKIALEVYDQKPENSDFIIPARLTDCDIPKKLKNLHWVNLFDSDGYELLILALQARAKKIKTADIILSSSTQHRSFSPVFQAPPIPPNFIARSDVNDDLKKLLLDSSAMEGAVSIVAIHGMGGIGKSSIASSLAHELSHDKFFNDGVLWTELGQAPDLLKLITEWIRALGDNDSQFNSIDAATRRLRSLLQNKDALLIIDNVWEPIHVKPFLVGAPCKILITTRRANVADSVGAVGNHFYELSVMKPAEALKVLAMPLKRQLELSEKLEAESLVNLLGYLPLGLQLAAACLVHGKSIFELRQALEKEIANLDILEGPRAENRLEAVFNFSLNAIRQEYPSAYEAFLWLGLIKDNSVITASMASVFWEKEKAEAARLLDLLWNDALLLLGHSITIDNHSYPTYNIHDLLYSFIRRLLIRDQPDGLGIRSIQAGHSILLSRYRNHLIENQWHTVPSDGYVHANLIWHMEQANELDSIHDLLKEETSDRRNGWFEACDKNGMTAAYISHIKRAWLAAERNPKNIQLGSQVRYALMISSVYSLAQKVPAALVAALVKNNIWTPPQGLIYARSILMFAERAKALALLTPHVPDYIQDEILLAGLETKHQMGQVWALAGIGKNIGARLQKDSWRAVLDAAKEIDRPQVQIQILTELSTLLPELMAKEARSYVLARSKLVSNPKDRAKGLLFFANQMLKRSFHQDALEALYMLGVQGWLTVWPYRSSSLLLDLWQFLRENVQRFADILSKSLKKESDFIETYYDDGSYKVEFRNTGMGTHNPLSGLYKSSSSGSGLGRIFSSRAREFSLLLNTLIWETIFLVLWRVGIRNSTRMGRFIAEKLLSKLEKIDGSLIAESTELKTLKEVTELPRENRIDDPIAALEKARTIHDDSNQLEALAAYAFRLPDGYIRDLLTVIGGTKHEGAKAGSIKAISPYLSEDLLWNAMAITRLIRDVNIRSDVLAALDVQTSILAVSRAKAGDARDAINLARGIGANDSKRQADALFEIIPDLSPPFIQEGLEAAIISVRKVKDTSYRIKRLSALLPYIKDKQLLREAIDSAFGSIRSIQNVVELIDALVTITPNLPADRQQDAILIPRSLNEPADRAYVLAAMAYHLQDPVRQEVAMEVCNRLADIDDSQQRIAVIDKIVCLLAEYEQERALQLVESIPVGSKENQVHTLFQRFMSKLMQGQKTYDRKQDLLRKQSNTLTSLIPHLTQSSKEEAIQLGIRITSTLRDPVAKINSFVSLAPYLTLDRKRELLGKVLELESGSVKVEQLIRLSLCLSDDMRDYALAKALETAQMNNDSEILTQQMLEMYPQLPAPLRKIASNLVIENVLRLRAAKDKLRVLRTLWTYEPDLTDEIRMAVYEVAKTSKDFGHDDESWEEILSFLLEMEDIQEALRLLASIESLETRRKTLISLAPKLTVLPKSKLVVLWSDMLHKLDNRTRRDFLLDIGAMTPIVGLLDENACVDIYQAIRDVGRWWP